MQTMTGALAKLGSCVVACLAAAGCPSDPPPSTILVGAVYDRSGTSSDPSRADGFNLGILHVNEGLRRAGYKGLQLEVRLEDGAARTELVVTRAVDLAQNLGAKILSVDVSQAASDVNGTFYDADPKSAEEFVKVGEAPAVKGLPVTEHAALAAVCLGMFNLDEALTRE